MSKINIDYELINDKEKVLSGNVIGIKKDNFINYKINDDMYSITIMEDEVRLIKKDKEKAFELLFSKNEKTEGKLTILNNNLYMNLQIDTLNLEINEYNIKINYKLYIENEFSNEVTYKLDWRNE